MSSRSDITDLIDAVAAPEAAFDFEAVFRAHYPRIARVIARVVRDPARSEELAVEVFLKLWRSPRAQGDKAGGWFYRVAVRKALDDLRRQARRARYERLFGSGQTLANPEQTQMLTSLTSVTKSGGGDGLVVQDEKLLAS
ncbi:MAG TPA: sigma factor [Candidatus Binatia bacterium]|nr:sigma factor [Candidatus Binatia bacterium]